MLAVSIECGQFLCEQNITFIAGLFASPNNILADPTNFVLYDFRTIKIIKHIIKGKYFIFQPSRTPLKRT